MAIRIRQGASPRLGRVTMPRGTYLPQQPKFSNPATSGTGSLGTGYALLPPTPQIGTIPGIGQDVASAWNATQQTNTGLPNVHQGLGAGVTSLPTQRSLTDIWNNLKNFVSQDFRNLGSAPDYLQPRGLFGNTLDLSKQPTTPTNILNNKGNSLVGANIATVPAGITAHQLRNVFPGLSAEQVQQTMAAKGYIRSYQPGVGEMWLKAGEGTGGSPSATGGAVDNRGRPEYVDATALAPGERVTAASGLTFVGGTPTASGQAQYAVTIPGGVDDDRYKWASSTKQDEAGNWVKVYRRELRKVYTRSHRRKQAQRRAERAEQPQPSTSVAPPIETQQLVNLRADFG